MVADLDSVGGSVGGSVRGRVGGRVRGRVVLGVDKMETIEGVDEVMDLGSILGIWICI